MRDLDFSYQVRKSARRKTLAITVHPDNRVVVSAPANYPLHKVLEFVEKKSNWIRKAFQANLQTAQQGLGRRFETGEKLLYLGREYILRVEQGTFPQVILTEGHIRVRLPVQGSRPEPSAVREHLLKWYMGCALAKIKERLPVYTRQIGASPCLVTVKSLKSRWGSCSVNGRISLAWNIIMAPERVLDYLIVHELCHLIHHNHSAEYWELVSAVLPNHRQSRKWLRENGDLLKL